jgi:hypothetical protein
MSTARWRDGLLGLATTMMDTAGIARRTSIPEGGREGGRSWQKASEQS